MTPSPRIKDRDSLRPLSRDQIADVVRDMLQVTVGNGFVTQIRDFLLQVNDITTRDVLERLKPYVTSRLSDLKRNPALVAAQILASANELVVNSNDIFTAVVKQLSDVPHDSGLLTAFYNGMHAQLKGATDYIPTRREVRQWAQKITPLSAELRAALLHDFGNQAHLRLRILFLLSDLVPAVLAPVFASQAIRFATLTTSYFQGKVDHSCNRK